MKGHSEARCKLKDKGWNMATWVYYLHPPHFPWGAFFSGSERVELKPSFWLNDNENMLVVWHREKKGEKVYSVWLQCCLSEHTIMFLLSWVEPRRVMNYLGPQNYDSFLECCKYEMNRQILSWRISNAMWLHSFSYTNSLLHLPSTSKNARHIIALLFIFSCCTVELQHSSSSSYTIHIYERAYSHMLLHTKDVHIPNLRDYFRPLSTLTNFPRTKSLHDSWPFSQKISQLLTSTTDINLHDNLIKHNTGNCMHQGPCYRNCLKTCLSSK